MTGPDDTGTVRLSGIVRPRAWVFAMDRANQEGVFQQALSNGSYDMELRADVGDEIVMWYEVDGDGSDSTTFKIKAP